MAIIKPKYICKYWRNGPIPSWRQDCMDRLLFLYPNCAIIESISKENVDNYRKSSDDWRFNIISHYDNCLWVDNDIWLDDVLDLPVGPGMAREYGCNHWSIMWSGNNPSYFKSKTFIDTAYDTNINGIQIKGTHWATDKRGNRVKRY